MTVPPGLNPYVPRPIDLPTMVPLDAGADLSVLDEARRRLGYTGAHYDQITGDCFTVCLAWLWDETLYDHERGTFHRGHFPRRRRACWSQARPTRCMCPC